MATDDLAYMLAMHWFPERHRRLERPRLDRRHAGLEAYGVRGCDRAALERDGQPSTRWLITRPVRRAADNILPVIWWNRLERAMRAVDDLDCRQRLQ